MSDPEVGRRYGVTRKIVRKWRYRREMEGRSRCSKRLHTTLTPEQEPFVVQVREVTLLSLDDLLIVSGELLNTWLEDFTVPFETSGRVGDLYRRINDTLEKGGSFAALNGIVPAQLNPRSLR